MPFRQNRSIQYYTFDNLDEAGLPHGIITRRGGISPEPWNSLNLGSTVGDDIQRVQENLRLAYEGIGRDPKSIFDVWQVHGSDIHCADAPRSPDENHKMVDGVLTDNSNVTLFMRFADCVPILLYDPGQKVVGLVHAGWKGTVQKTCQAAVQKMQKCYRSKPQDILAAIGPSIGAHHYEIGPEVESQVRATFDEDAAVLLPRDDGHTCFDLWSANRLILEQSGVNNIEVAGLCTACDSVNWYSHRQQKGKTGRFGAFIALSDR